MDNDWPVVRCWHRTLLSAAALAWAAPLPGSFSQEFAPQYTAAMLDGAAFDLRVRATVRTRSDGPFRVETIARDGRLAFRVTGVRDTLRVEAWFDSLRVHREGPEGRLSPDTDGLIGGRFRGTLTPDGRYASTSRPFIPDELAEVTDLADAVADLLPRLPPTALPVGGRWDEGPLRIVRRADSTVLARYRWSLVRTDTAVAFLDDSLRYETQTAHREEGDLVWHPALGPLAWHRMTRIEVVIPATGAVRRSTRTQFEEEDWAWRRRGPR